jgi:UDP-N-acetylglucosamine--N-acetylmuramyl-(pentapeptide) pyrophosphoryl-undecaprenol N-acetylglucosamine transferase
MKAVDPSVSIETITAGKFRRYHQLGLLRQLLQLRTIVLPNIIDAFKLTYGLVQSLFKLYRWRPDVIFTKGGFVCLPVGIAAKMLRIPLVIHDSDAHPGLTNRILARFASAIATGAPLKYYTYPKEKTSYVGIPVASALKPFSAAGQRDAKLKLGFSPDDPLLVVTGGGLGAKAINDATMKVLKDLLRFTSVALIAGSAHEKQIRATAPKAKNFKLYGYVAEDMVTMLAASDVVVCRAGATTLLELAALKKASIVIPNANLTGGHQTKNATVYKQADAAIVIEETSLIAQPLSLVDAVNALLLNSALRNKLSKNIGALSRPNAAKDVAALIIRATK